MGSKIMALGRIGVDFFAREENTPLKDVRTFMRTQGGSTSNIAVNLAKLGHQVSLITKVGQDPMGDYLVDHLKSVDVDTSLVGRDPQARTSLAVVEVSPPSSFTTVFFRENCADLMLNLDDVPFDQLVQAALLLVGGTSLTASPSRETVLYTLQKISFMQSRPTVVFDLDYRQILWDAQENAALYLWQAVKMADIIFANDEEVKILASLCPLDQVISEVLQGRCQIFVHKNGAAGATIHTKEQKIAVPAYPTNVLSTNGAGDAFAAAFCHGLTQNLSLEKCGQLGSAAGAINVSRVSCTEAMPTLEEIANLIKGP